MFGHWRRTSMMLAMDYNLQCSLSRRVAGLFRWGHGILSTGGGMIDAGRCRLGANEGRIGSADGDKTR